MIKTLLSLVLLPLLVSCSTMPLGPAVLVLPGADKDFTQFHNDDVNCKQYAREQIASSKDKPNSEEEAQQFYDIGFIQCMYGKGHRVPVPGNLVYDFLREEDESRPPEVETTKD